MDNEHPKMIEALAKFPGEFGLHGHPNKIFRVSPSASFMSGNVVLLYTQVKFGDAWYDFAKGTVEELTHNFVPLKQGD